MYLVPLGGGKEATWRKRLLIFIPVGREGRREGMRRETDETNPFYSRSCLTKQAGEALFNFTYCIPYPISLLILLRKTPVILGRVALSITTLLTLASMFGALSVITPAVAYTTRLDAWIIGCFCFVSAVLVETAAAVFVHFHLADNNGIPGCFGRHKSTSRKEKKPRLSSSRRVRTVASASSSSSSSLRERWKLWPFKTFLV